MSNQYLKMGVKKAKPQAAYTQQSSDPQQLPSKEASSFRTLIKLYEAKQFRKGIKIADQILHKYPDHGETLAMKGLLLHYQNKKQEANDMVKKGLQSNLKSHVCWHVYGMLNRFERNYEQAIKSYKQALNLNKDNLQYLRDLSQLQIQVRDVQGLIESRNQILSMKPNNRAHWITLVFAYKMDKNYSMAIKILELYENSIEDKPTTGQDAYEYSELVLYKAQLYLENKQYSNSLEILQKQGKYIKDKIGIKELQVQIYSILNQHEEAAEIYRTLISVNPENYEYHYKYQEQFKLHLGLSQGNMEQQYQFLKQMYITLQEKFPHSNACKRIPLDFLEGEDFIAALDIQARRFINKGIPSLYTNLNGLYNNPQKVIIIEKLFIEYLNYVYVNGTLPKTSEAQNQNGAVLYGITSRIADITVNAKASETDQSKDSTQVYQNGYQEKEINGQLLQELEDFKGPQMNGSTDNKENGSVAQKNNKLFGWLSYFLAQHFLGKQKIDLALKLAKNAVYQLEVEPDTLILFAKILKRAGDTVGSYEIADYARKLDMQDRYINTQAVRRLFQGNQVERAERTYTYFTKDNEYISSFFDMQNIWYEAKCGQAFYRLGNYGKALKNFIAIKKHFEDFDEDQIDFHQYCMRRLTLRSYQEFIEVQDRLKEHKFFALGINGSIKCYLDLYERSSNQGSDQNKNENGEDMTPEERKKQKQKQKKEAQKQKQQQEKESSKGQQESTKSQASQTKSKSQEKYKDPDPEGQQLLSVEDKLQEAKNLAKGLNQYHYKDLNTHSLSMQIYLYKDQYLLALKSIVQALKIGSEEHPQIHEMIVKFALAYEKCLQNNQIEINEVVKDIIDKKIQEILKEQPIKQYNDRYYELYGSQGLSKKFAALKMRYQIDQNSEESVAQELCNSEDLIRQASHQECVEIYKYLDTKLKQQEAKQKFQQLCQQHFKYSTFFQGLLVIDYNEFLQNLDSYLQTKTESKDENKDETQK